MTQVIDLLTKALRVIGAYAPGEQLDPDDAKDAFDMLNDWLEMQSNSTQMVPYVTEIIFPITTNKASYTIGPGGEIGASFTGSIASRVLTVSAISSGDIALGQTLTGAGITAGTQVISFATGAGGLGTYNLNIAQTVGSEVMQAGYQRPLRINSAFARVATLDYTVAVVNIERFELIRLKTLNGPWPRALYYQPTVPLGNIMFWPVPAIGEMHLFAETVLQGFATMNDVVNLPQGYNMAIRWNLAEMLAPEFGKVNAELLEVIRRNAADARAWIKRTNMQPVASASFDPALLVHRPVDAGWIMHGGFLP